MTGLRPAVLALLLATGAAAQETHVLVVTGLGGSPEYTERFAGWGAGLVEAALAAGVAPERVTWLAERDGLHGRAGGVARKERVAAALDAVVGRSASGDLVLVALFGHGSARGGESNINLPGPDLSAGELASLLERLENRRVVVVNAASASGGFVPVLSAPGRVVITATRTAGETEATRFGGFFVDALRGAGADTDKDGAVSMLEAFEYARREVARTFADAGQLPTEHALLEDEVDGRLAARLTLGQAPGTAAASAAETGDPVLRELLAEKERLEAELATLRSREGEMSADAYQRELERLLLEVARNGRAIRDRQGGGDG